MNVHLIDQDSLYQLQATEDYLLLGKHTSMYTIAKLLREGNTSKREALVVDLDQEDIFKISLRVLHIVEAQMQLDDKTTAVQLEKILADQGHKLSLKSILRSRSKLGWTFHGSAYCQLIREQNKAKRLEWAIENKDAALNGEFTDVVWTDECSV